MLDEELPALTWSDEIDEVLGSDLAVTLACATPAGGAVALAVTCAGMRDRDAGTVTFTTSKGIAKKLDRIRAEPRVALLFHTRRHGQGSTSPLTVLVQGVAEVVEEPTEAQREQVADAATRFMGTMPSGPLWDWYMREFMEVRVPVIVHATRITTWPDPRLSSASVLGAPPAARAPGQRPPARGVAPRISLERAARRVRRVPHHLLAFLDADGAPTAVPVSIDGACDTGLRLRTPPGLLPLGPRRAGLLAHDFGPQLVGLDTRYFTGWLQPDTDDEGIAAYAPHTEKGYSVPPNRTLVLLANGGLAKVGVWQARRSQRRPRPAVLPSPEREHDMS